MPKGFRDTALACALCVLAALSGGRAAAQPAPLPAPGSEPAPASPHRELSRSDFGEPEQPEPAEAESGDGKLEPWLFIGLASASAIMGGIAIWSGLDTVARNDAYKYYALQPDASPGEARRGYSDAHSAQTRTNVLIASTAILAAATVVVGVWFTEWDDGERAPEATLAPYIGLSERAAGLQFVQEL